MTERESALTRCKFCGFRWQGCTIPFTPGQPLPGKDLACPECGMAGMSIVLDFEPQRPLL